MKHLNINTKTREHVNTFKLFYTFSRRLISLWLTLFTIFILLASCSAPSGLGFGTETMSGPSGSDATAPASGSTGGGDDVLGGSGGSDPAAAPQSSIPLPNVRSEYIVAYATDDSGVVPVKGFAGAADYDASYQMLVSTEDPATYVASRSSVNGKRSTLSFARSAYADDLDFGLCSETSATCCPIETDGSFECYVQTSGVSVGSVFYTIVDGDGIFVEGYDATTASTLVATAEVEDVNENALFLAQAPKDLDYVGDSASSTHIGLIGNDTLLNVKISDTDGAQVIGDYRSSYAQGSAVSVTQMAMNPDTASLDLLVPDDGIALWGGAVDTYTDTFIPRSAASYTTVPDTESYTAIKLASNDEIWFGRKPVSATFSREYIYKYDYNFSDPLMTYPSSYEYQLEIYDQASEPVNIFSETVAFDIAKVDGYNVGVAIYKDTDENFRISMGYVEAEEDSRSHIITYSYRIEGGTTAYSSVDHNFTDIMIVKEQSGSSDDSTEFGTIAILDSQDEKVWFKDYFADVEVAVGSSTFDDTTLTDYVEVGSSPLSLAFNADKDTLFVLNSDNTVTAFRTKDSAGAMLTTFAMTTTKQTIDLATDYFSGKSVALTPNKLIVQATTAGTDYILVGMEGIEGMLAFEAPTIAEPVPLTPASMPTDTALPAWRPPSMPARLPAAGPTVE